MLSAPLEPQDMAGSRFACVHGLELPDPLLPDTYIVLKIDGYSFSAVQSFPRRFARSLAFCFNGFSEDHSLRSQTTPGHCSSMHETANSVMERFPDAIWRIGWIQVGRCQSEKHTPAAEDRVHDQLFAQGIHQRL